MFLQLGRMQRSVFGPILFVMYTVELGQVITHLTNKVPYYL